MPHRPFSRYLRPTAGFFTKARFLEGSFAQDLTLLHSLANDVSIRITALPARLFFATNDTDYAEWNKEQMEYTLIYYEYPHIS